MRPVHRTITAVFVLGCAALVHTADRELIGWLGEVQQARDPENKLIAERVDGIFRSNVKMPKPHPEGRYVQPLSWDDRIFAVHNFLTPEECDVLVDEASKRLRRSTVVNKETGGGVQDGVRTSSGMFFDRAQDSVIKAVEERIGMVTMVPPVNGEGIQVLRYEEGQKYDPHFDHFSHKAGNDNGGNRLVTVLMYLCDVEEGGETVFPNVPAPPHQQRPEFSECAMQGLAVKPYKGLAVVFWSLKTTGQFNKASLHGGCPVLKGQKWAATKWIHIGRYAERGEQAERLDAVMYLPPVPPACKDLDPESCPGWAQQGECDANPSFMVGDSQRPGNCIMSCQRCDLVPVLEEWERRQQGNGNRKLRVGADE